VASLSKRQLFISKLTSVSIIKEMIKGSYLYSYVNIFIGSFVRTDVILSL